MQRVALKLDEALRRRADGTPDFGYDATLLRSTWRWVHVRTPLFLARAALRIASAARRGAVDVVLFSSMVTASLAVPLQSLLRRHDVRTAAITHGLDVTTPFPPYQWFVPKVFGALDAVLPVSQATREACRARGATSKQLRVIPNGIDPDRFRPPDDRASARTALEQALSSPAPPPLPDGLLLCSVGRHVERKGFGWFVDAVMPRLPEAVHYWVAGEGPRTPHIRRIVRQRGLRDRVRLLGRISDDNLARLYRGADLFVMPNVPVEGDMEGFGIVLLEAGQCGTPSIAARLEGIQDVVAEGENGHLVEPRNARAFADIIRQYLESPERLASASRRAVAYTTERFGWASVADTYLSVLRGLHRTGRPVACAPPAGP